MDGSSGYVSLIAGNATVQEYYEMDPVNKRIVEYSDGNKHQVIQADSKRIVFGNEIREVIGALEFNTGLNPLDVPTNFDMLNVDPDMTPGDIRFDNTGTIPPGLGRMQLFIQGDVDIFSYTGDINIISTLGTINITAPVVNINSPDLNLNSSANLNITAAVKIQLTAPAIDLN